jgi:hypothetical protein
MNHVATAFSTLTSTMALVVVGAMHHDQNQNKVLSHQECSGRTFQLMIGVVNGPEVKNWFILSSVLQTTRGHE